MPQRPLSVILICVGTMAGVTALYAITLFALAIWTKDATLQLKALEQFKDFGIFAGGALVGFLARTSTGVAENKPTEQEPLPVTVENPPTKPIPTKPKP